MMKCTHCGAFIPDDKMICPQCGAEVQIVPDYNPLDEVLAREVKGSVEGSGRPSGAGQNPSERRDARPNNAKNTGRNLTKQDVQRMKQREERRRAQQQRRIQAAKRKRRNLLIGMFLILVAAAAAIYAAYSNSYAGVMRKGQSALTSGNYEGAEKYFNKAIEKDQSKADAYIGLADMYYAKGDLEGAEQTYLTAVATLPSSAELYMAAIRFYETTDQLSKISALLEDCEDEGVLKAVGAYASDAPEFSLKSGTYEEVQQVSVKSYTGGTIYYTLDGSDPKTAGVKYTEPILLQDEGEFNVMAVAVNEKGVPSVTASAVYKIEFPVADAPAVSPSTGQYSEPVQITIQVPEGYTAYYTMDGTVPTKSSSKYTAPIDMPKEDQIVFNAVLINDANGKVTSVTTRTYFIISE